MLTLVDTQCNFNEVEVEFGVLPKIKYLDDPIKIYPYCFKTLISENKPFILKSCASDWTSFSDWVQEGKPNFSHLCKKYGDVVAPVANCNSYYFNAHEKTNMTVREFMNYWKNFTNNSKSSPCYYLKDWHFTRDFKSEKIYRVPNVFASDWLNEYYSEHLQHSDDYQFVYMGPKSSWTPLHADVFHSFSWSVNICGKKQWLLLAPGNEKFFKDPLGNLVSDMKSIDWTSLPKNTVITIEQEAGDGIFIPSGWHHQVTNLGETISVNHNWINGCNILHVFEELVSHLEAVKKEIDDCKTMDDWESHCQLMLQVSFGMNFKQFFDMLDFISQKRIASLKVGNKILLNGDWALGLDHVIFDLNRALQVLEECMKHEDWKFLRETNQLIDEIKLVI